MENINESKNLSNPQTAAVDMAKALQVVFKKYSRTARESAWKSLMSKNGRKQIDELLYTPTRSLNMFATLWSAKSPKFADWYKKKQS